MLAPSRDEQNERRPMRLRKLHRRKTLRRQGLAGIAPIYKVSLEGEAKLIGTGFWITEAGHLISAWHVIEDNIAEDGIDRGPIYAMQSVGGGAAIPRVLRKTHKHKIFDLSLSETLVVETERPLALPLEECSDRVIFPSIKERAGLDHSKSVQNMMFFSHLWVQSASPNLR
jgi:hypothetical protein